MSELTDTQPADTTPRDFASFLIEQAKGQSHEELSEGLQELVKRVQDTGRPGTITYTVKIAPLKANTDMVTVTDEIKLRLPEFDRPASLFYVSETGNLQRNDPHQPSLFDVSYPPSHLAVVDTDTGQIKE